MAASGQTGMDSATPRRVRGTDEQMVEGSVRERLAPIVAVVLLLVFAVVLGILFVRLDLPQQQWDRAVYLLNGVEAVAFAAAGYLFGKEVNRQRADAAEQQAQVERERAATAEQQAANGRKLAGMVVGVAAAQQHGGTLESMDDEGTAGLRVLAAEARRLFPDEPSMRP